MRSDDNLHGDRGHRHRHHDRHHDWSLSLSYLLYVRFNCPSRPGWICRVAKAAKLVPCQEMRISIMITCTCAWISYRTGRCTWDAASSSALCMGPRMSLTHKGGLERETRWLVRPLAPAPAAAWASPGSGSSSRRQLLGMCSHGYYHHFWHFKAGSFGRVLLPGKPTSLERTQAARASKTRFTYPPYCKVGGWDSGLLNPKGTKRASPTTDPSKMLRRIGLSSLPS